MSRTRTQLAALCAGTLLMAATQAEDAVEAGASRWQSHLAMTASAQYFSSDNELSERTHLFGGAFRAKLDTEHDDWLTARVDLRASSLAAASEAATLTVSEAFVTLRTEHSTLRLGKQIVAWGRADFLNPTDNLTPRDFTAPLTSELEQRFGTVAALYTQDLGAVTWSIFATPLFEPTRVPLPRGAQHFVQERPARAMRNGEVGVRLDRTGNRFDASLSYFHGYALEPDLELQQSGSIALHYPRVSVLGADFATTLGSYGLRMEVAYTDVAASESAFRRKPSWFYVFGADRTFGGSTNVNLQFFGRHISHFNRRTQSDALSQAIANYSALLAHQQTPASYGLTARFSKSWWRETLTTELLVVHDFTGHDSYLTPKLTYAASDRMTAMFGGRLYAGRDLSFFGSLERNQQVFAEVRWSL